MFDLCMEQHALSYPYCPLHSLAQQVPADKIADTIRYPKSLNSGYTPAADRAYVKTVGL